MTTAVTTAIFLIAIELFTIGLLSSNLARALKLKMLWSVYTSLFLIALNAYFVVFNIHFIFYLFTSKA